ncbi:MAG: YceD family protein [Bacilli bacterium]
MLIDLSKIDAKGKDIDLVISFESDYIKNTPIKKLDNVVVKGRIFYDVTSEVIMDVNIKGEMVLLDAVDLEPINYPFDININEAVSESGEEFSESFEKTSNTLDIKSFLWQNIVLEVPIRVVRDENKDISIEGNGWELIDENTKKVDPRLSPLAALLEKEGKE